MKEDENLQEGILSGTPIQCQTNPPHRILLVDDDLFVSRFNTAALTRFGYEVVSANDGAAAWSALNDDAYDLIITDNDMPNLTGVELLKMLRSAHMVAPVIMASLKLPVDEFARQPWLLPAATLAKPYTVGELLRTVKRVLREAESAADRFQRVINGLEADELLHAPARAGTRRQAPMKSPPRILVVDADSALRQLYAEVLTRPGFYVDVVADGEGGWEALQSGNYNLLITENDMPHLSGVELIKKARAAHLALPAVVVTAGRVAPRELALNPALHLAATLVKPFAIEHLLNTVNAVLYPMEDPGEKIAAYATASTPAFSKIRQQPGAGAHWGLNE